MSGERGAQLTRQLPTFSRRQAPEPQIVSVHDLIVTLEGMLRRVIGEQVELVVDTYPRSATVHADPGQMEQVLINLAVNARDAMPGGGRLTIRVRDMHLAEEVSRLAPDAQPGQYVVTTVTDTGTGMEQDVLDRIFDPFFTTKPEGEGTGLGLSTSYAIVTQNMGYMSVDSKPGKGTTFAIYLPAVDEQPEVPSGPGEVDELVAGTETVLLVEDESVVMHLTADVLLRQGYTVLTASNGADAAEVMDQYDGPIDLLFTDVVMPVMGGYELASRYVERYPKGKVIYISGYPDTRASDPSFSGPQGEFLQKPVSLTSLTARIRQVLGPVSET